MGLRMKIYNIFGVHWKTQLLGRVQVKQIYRGDCLKKGRGVGGFGLFADLRGSRGGACQERGGGVFEGGWYPNPHYEW